jgi:cytochrome P450 / NADPH-cytochrome P450 reductase
MEVGAPPEAWRTSTRSCARNGSAITGAASSLRGKLFPSLAKALDLPAATAEAKMAAPRISVSFVNRLATSPIMRSYSAVAMTVRVNRELQRRDCERPSERSTRHIEIALPSGVSYSAGDHLGIVPRNGLETIRRVLMRFKLDPSLYATIAPRANADTHLPVNEPVPLLGILANRIELQDVATREQIATLAQHAKDEKERKALEALGHDDECYSSQVFASRKSALDILDENRSCALPFEVFLDMTPPLRPRYYSISSSPLVSAGICSITVGVLEGRALSGRGEFRGVCSNYLAAQPADATVYAFVRKPTIPFRPPREPAPANDHDRAGHGRRAIPGLPARARGVEETGRADRRVPPLLRLPRSHAGLSL